MARLSLADLPREVLRLIALRLYDPLELTQQDRLTWGIFSTVDMHQERQDDLATLVALGWTCRKIRREVRRILFNCVRIPSVEHAEELVRNKDGWATYVKSIIIDLTMFDLDEDASTRTRLSPLTAEHKPRTCWAESALLTKLLNSLPSLNHMSFFADASDDSTLALLFAALIQHPSLHSVPPTVPSSPSALSTASGATQVVPLTHRLKSFGWRQRAAPPHLFRQFSQSSTFVSTLHLLRHAHNLSFLVLDADMDQMNKSDILAAVKELSLRRPPYGETVEKVSLMLCGPINGWETGFLDDLVGTFKDIKELFVDRPLKKSTQAHAKSYESLISLLKPLEQLPYLRLLQVGSYTFTSSFQAEICFHLARSIPSLLIVGLLGEEGETIWWGVWRRASSRGLRHAQEGLYEDLTDTRIIPLGDGHLRQLEDEVDEWMRSLPPTPPQEEEDVRMSPISPISETFERQGLQFDTEGGHGKAKGMMSLDRLLG
ncbi:hypothetical protein CI109_106349 [Kwoniella shandongensis]|uniref:Uncharacterized protein n=1 Tax=Kwoniella shandongensis TaxID=1734106 RepID=A0A5M6BNF4_9TREE|nr:uncharacterized protein CI109_007457 [Kwoniella shandongensis]KAA5524217.1 hypothetical protein CI109_007457 [Kwoniella shandongensis]